MLNKLNMINRVLFYIILVFFVVNLNGCFSSTNEKANKLFVQLTESSRQIKEVDSYSQMYDMYRKLKLDTDNIVKTYPSSDIAVSLVSGIAKISGLSYDQLSERETELKRLSSAENDLFSTSLLLCELIEKKSEKASTLIHIISSLAKVGRIDQAKNAASQLMNLAEEDGERDDALLFVVKAFVQAGKPDQAFKFAEKIGVKSKKFIALENIAKAFAQAGKLDQALKIAEMVVIADGENYSKRPEYLIMVAINLAESGKVDQAQDLIFQTLEMVETLEDIADTERTNILGWAAIAFAKTGDFKQALTVIMKIKEDYKIADACKKIASTFSERGDVYTYEKSISLALEIANLIKIKYSRDSALADIAIVLAEAGEIDRAIEIVKTIPQPEIPLKHIAIALAKSNKIKKAIEIAEKNNAKIQKCDALIEISDILFETGEEDLAQSTITSALNVATSIDLKAFGVDYSVEMLKK